MHWQRVSEAWIGWILARRHIEEHPLKNSQESTRKRLLTFWGAQRQGNATKSVKVHKRKRNTIVKEEQKVEIDEEEKKRREERVKKEEQKKYNLQETRYLARKGKATQHTQAGNWLDKRRQGKEHTFCLSQTLARIGFRAAHTLTIRVQWRVSRIKDEVLWWVLAPRKHPNDALKALWKRCDSRLRRKEVMSIFFLSLSSSTTIYLFIYPSDYLSTRI